MTTTATEPTTPEPADIPAAHHGYHQHKDDVLTRLRKVEGQVRGLERMIENDRYCIDVLTQVSAVTRALQEVALGLLDDHTRHCITDAARRDPDQAEGKYEELVTALRLTLRL